MADTYSIETVFQQIKDELRSKIQMQDFVCTQKWKRLYSYLRARKFRGDINHITGDIHTIALFLDRQNTLVTVHDIGAYERGNPLKKINKVKKLLLKKIWLDYPLKKVRYITTISGYTKQRLIEICSIPGNKISVIYNPAPTDFVPFEKTFNGDKPAILQIGSGEQKNLLRLIEAIKGMDFTLILVRRPDKQIEYLLEEYNIVFEWKSNLSREGVYDCYKKCDIVFFASEYEGFGVPILEANAVGRPVVTSNIASMPEVAGNSALLVNPFNINEIKEALNKIRTDHVLRQQLVEKGYQNLKRFDPSMIANQYLDLYYKIYNEG